MAPSWRIRVYLADDHPLFLGRLAAAVRAQPALELVGETGNGSQALEDLRRLQPDVAVVDKEMERQEIVDAVAPSSARELQVLALTAQGKSTPATCN
jgi:chemotaxis response regulator CheB